ncbi:MAG: helix-turn-helix transcriptional regulator [Chitinophagaceae bacterium]|nr:helix-turn-helix transcriptional regulator [Chitinophagaceae bacterium]
MPKKVRTYQENFIAAVKYYMAENNISHIKVASRKLNVGYMALYKIMNGTNGPSVEMCILLCKKAGFSANWLLLNKGEIYINDEESLSKIFTELKDLKHKLKIG